MKINSSPTNMNKKGFTLIELLVVIAIIGLLSGVVLASLNQTRIKARDSAREESLIQMRNALALYAADHGGSYPYYPEVTRGVTSCGDDIYPGFKNWENNLGQDLKPYISKLPEGPKQNCSRKEDYFVYISNETEYKLVLLNSESEVGTESIFNNPSTISYDNDNEDTKSWAIYSENGGLLDNEWTLGG